MLHWINGQFIAEEVRKSSSSWDLWKPGTMTIDLIHLSLPFLYEILVHHQWSSKFELLSEHCCYLQNTRKLRGTIKGVSAFDFSSLENGESYVTTISTNSFVYWIVRALIYCRIGHCVWEWEFEDAGDFRWLSVHSIMLVSVVRCSRLKRQEFGFQFKGRRWINLGSFVSTLSWPSFWRREQRWQPFTTHLVPPRSKVI
jgi:hypothetical protein